MYMQCIYGTWGSFLRSVWEEFVGQVWEWESWSSHCHRWAFLAFISGRKCQRRLSLPLGLALAHAAPSQFNIQEEHWKVREVSKSSDHNYKDGKQNLKSQIQEAFLVFQEYMEEMIVLPVFACPRPLFKRGKVEVMFLEAVEEIISALSLWLQKGKGRIWCWKSVLDLVMAFPCDIK